MPPPPANTRQRSFLTSPRFLIGLPAAAVVCAFAWIALAPQVWYWNYEPREGDIVFQSLPPNGLTAAIEGSTDSPWSHCGIVAKENGQWFVYEAYGQVQRVTLDAFWSRSRARQFGVYRLREEHQSHVSTVLECIRSWVGKPYDEKYRMDDETLYCSELIYKAWKQVTGQEMGTLVRLGDLNWKPYEATIRKIEGGSPPLDRLMITPRGLSEAKQLEHLRSFGVGR